jgi:very-short-patch-repair endonuclease
MGGAGGGWDVPSDLTSLAKKLRGDMTDAEKKLWHRLRAGQVGVKFRRQQPIGRYIVDFVCLDRKLIVELDGGQHANATEYDAARTQWLENQGFTVLRFWNNDIMSNIEGVLTRIVETLSPSPQPSPIKGEGANRRNQ